MPTRPLLYASLRRAHLRSWRRLEVAATRPRLPPPTLPLAPRLLPAARCRTWGWWGAARSASTSSLCRCAPSTLAIDGTALAAAWKPRAGAFSPPLAWCLWIGNLQHSSLLLFYAVVQPNVPAAGPGEAGAPPGEPATKKKRSLDDLMGEWCWYQGTGTCHTTGPFQTGKGVSVCGNLAPRLGTSPQQVADCWRTAEKAFAFHVMPMACSVGRQFLRAGLDWLTHPRLHPFRFGGVAGGSDAGETTIGFGAAPAGQAATGPVAAKQEQGAAAAAEPPAVPAFLQAANVQAVYGGASGSDKQ
jgi:hypothetical protein